MTAPEGEVSQLNQHTHVTSHVSITQSFISSPFSITYVMKNMRGESKALPHLSQRIPRGSKGLLISLVHTCMAMYVMSLSHICLLLRGSEQRRQGPWEGLG